MATSLRRGSTNQQIMQYYGPQIASMQAAGQPLPTELQTIAPQIEAIRQQDAAERAAQAERARLWQIRSAEIEAQQAAEEARINALSVDEAQTIIADQIRNQKQLLEGQGVKWNAGIPDEEVIQDMASRLARAGAKSIYDVRPMQIPVDPNVGYDSGSKTVLYNTRTNQEVPPEYAFASMGDAGGTWGGTFAGPGSTRYEIQFVGNTPVFTAQQQATVKSGAEKLAGIAAPIALGFALGPAGLGLSSTAAGALAGGVGGLLNSGDIEGALKGAALGGVLGYGKEALFGAGTAASDLAQIEASMGTPGLLGSPDVLDAVNQAGIYTDVMTPPPIINEPVLVPGDNRLVSTLAQPPLAVENIAGQLTPEAQALMLSSTLPVTPLVVETPAGVLSPDTANIINTTAVEGSMTPVTTGDPTKAALYSNEGYGPLSDQTVTGAPITSSPITSLGPAATLKDITDYLTGGAFAGNVTDALKEAFKAATGSGQQQGSGSNFLGPIIGGLLSRQQQGAPTPGIIQGKGVDITSPIQSLLAPKLVQQRPVTLL